MKIICPKCGADYNINDSKIPPDGLHIKCPKCLHSFVATKDGAASLGNASAPGGLISTSSMRALGVPPPPGAPPPQGAAPQGGSPIMQTVQGMPVRPVGLPMPPTPRPLATSAAPPPAPPRPPALSAAPPPRPPAVSAAPPPAPPPPRPPALSAAPPPGPPPPRPPAVSAAPPAAPPPRPPAAVAPPPAPPRAPPSAPMPAFPPTPPGAMPAAPPPPRPSMPQVSVDLVDEIEDIDEPADPSGATIAQTGNLFVRAADGRVLGPFTPEDARELVLQGRLTGHESASFDQKSWLPLISFPGLSGLTPSQAAPAGPHNGGHDFDFSFSDAPKTNAGAEPDDFDFSFSDLPKGESSGGLLGPPAAPPRPAVAARAPARGTAPATGGNNLHDLFDDLPDDLPAPKAASAGGMSDLSDLPAPKSAVPSRRPSGGVDLPGLRDGLDLPGLRDQAGLPGLRDEGGLPGLRDEGGLPGLKGEAGLPGLRGEAGLPGMRGVAGLPGARGQAGLPGVRGESGLPGVRGESGLPGVPELSGLVAPLGGELPSLPGDDAARQFAEGGLSDELEGTGTAPPQPTARKRKLILIGGLVAGLAITAGVAAVLLMDDGPEGGDVRGGTGETVSGVNVPTPPTVGPSGTESAPANPSEVAPAVANEATLAEVAGYRAAIGAREQKGEGVGSETIDLIELYAFGALEFPGNNEWVRRSGELAAKLDDATKATMPGKRARIAAGIANSDGAALNEAIELAKGNPADARCQYLAGHAWHLKNDLEAEYAAFDKARTLAPELIAAARLAGEAAIRRGDMEHARPLLEGVLKIAPGTPSVAVSLAAIELHKGVNDRAQKLIDQILAMSPERATPTDRSAAMMLRARLELGRGQEDIGLRTLEEAIKVNPRNLGAVELLSARHFATKNYDKALTQFESLRANGASTPEIVISIARCQEALNNADKALAELTEGATKFPQSAALQAAIGDSERRRSQFDEARAAYDKSLAIDPTYEEAYLRIADLLVGQAKVGDAADFLAKALVGRPSSAMLHFGAGDLKQRLAGSNLDETMLNAAEREFREAIRLEPTMLTARHHLAQTLLDKGDAAGAMKELAGLQARPDYHDDLAYDIGRAQQALGKFDDAIKSYEDALTRRKDDPKALLAAGTAYFAKKDFAQATERLTKAAQLANKLTAAHFYLGRVALEQKNISLAVQKFQLASDEEAANNEYRYWLGRALLDAGQPKQAYQELTSVTQNIVNDPKSAKKLCDAHFQRGQLRFSGVADGTRDWRGAQGDFKAALDCDDKRAEVWTAYGDTFEVNQPDIAIQHYSKAIAVDRDFGLAYLKRGVVVNRTSENPARAKGDFEAAVRLDPTLAEPNYHLCVIYMSQNSRGLAKKHCEKYLELSPKGDEAPGARDILDDLKKNP